MADDIELFLLGWRLEIRIDRFKVFLCGPAGAGRQPPASIPKLRFAHGVWRVHKMQLVLNMCALDQLAKPCPLCFRGGCEIEHDGDPIRQENANVWRERVLQSRITVHEGRNVGDLARKQGIQEIARYEKDSIFSNGQFSCESGLACRHLPAQEDQLR